MMRTGLQLNILPSLVGYAATFTRAHRTYIRAAAKIRSGNEAAKAKSGY
jgi:hypothetical protein